MSISYKCQKAEAGIYTINNCQVNFLKDNVTEVIYTDARGNKRCDVFRGVEILLYAAERVGRVFSIDKTFKLKESQIDV